LLSKLSPREKVFLFLMIEEVFKKSQHLGGRRQEAGGRRIIT
jgi:hypothetical protein